MADGAPRARQRTRPEAAANPKVRPRRAPAAAAEPAAGASDGPRTRGGWTPVGTAADRRAAHEERSTARGQQTRRQIVAAARRVFERVGFVDASVDDIVVEAGVARGSFYTYFTSKVEVFRVVTAEVSDQIDAALVSRPDDERLDPVDTLARSNGRYMVAYRDNARVYALLEQMAHADPETLARFVARRGADIERVAATIRRWQARGVADPTVDPVPTAAALVSLTRHLCFWLYVGGDLGYTEAQAADTLQDVWVRTVDLRRTPNRKWLAAAGR